MHIFRYATDKHPIIMYGGLSTTHESIWINIKEKPDQIKSIQKIKLAILLPKNVGFLYNLIIENKKNKKKNIFSNGNF